MERQLLRCLRWAGCIHRKMHGALRRGWYREAGQQARVIFSLSCSATLPFKPDGTIFWMVILTLVIANQKHKTPSVYLL